MEFKKITSGHLSVFATTGKRVSSIADNPPRYRIERVPGEKDVRWRLLAWSGDAQGADGSMGAYVLVKYRRTSDALFPLLKKAIEEADRLEWQRMGREKD